MPQATQKSFIYLSLIGALILLIALAVQPITAQVAAVTVTAPEFALVNEQFEFTVTFDNTGTSTGYGPFIDLWIPYDGADGATTAPGADGVRFNDAWFLNVGTGGVPVTAQEFTFPASGCIDHPYLRDPLLNPVPVCGSPGDHLVVLDVPLGAITPDFPEVEIIVRATVSEYADIGVPLNIVARGGFRFGANPVDDPCCDAYILSAQASAPVTPLVYTMTKRGAGDLLETVTGPNFVQDWLITLDIADGQQVDDLTVTDYLPDNVTIVGFSTTPNIPGTTTVPSLPFGPVNPPGNELLIDFPSGSPITGTTATDDLVITVQFHGTLNDASGNPVLGGIGVDDDAPALNRFMGAGDWPPNDVRDAAIPDNATFNGLCPTVCPGGNAPILLGIAVQKTIITAIVDNPPTGRSPGDILEYQLNFQVSDYYTYADIQITDVLSDGQAFDSTFTPTFDVWNRGVNYAGSFAPADYDVLAGTPGPGQTTINFRVSDQLATAGLAGGIIQGGRAQAPDTTGAEGTIVYRVEILESYNGPVAGNTSAVDQWDNLNNAAVVSGTVRSNTPPYNPTGDSETDVAFNDFDIINGEPDKGVYAINGTPCGACTGVIVQAGDVVTYRIGQNLPASDFDDFSLTEYLPLPVFDVSGFSIGFDTTIDTTPPPVNTAKFGPLEDLYTLSGSTLAPAITIDVPGNAITFNWGGYDGDNNTPSIVDVLFSVEVTSRPFADDLTLANLVRSNEWSTQHVLRHQDATAPITARVPLLRMTKGAVATDGPATFSPGTTGPVPFNPPGSGTAFTGTINSDNLGAAPIDSDLTGLQPGDLVTFAIAIENAGTSSQGAFDIRVRDSIPSGFTVPSGGPNLQVVLGNGLALAYTSLGGGGDNDLFGPGIELVDPGIGVCSPYHATSGTNIVIITYDLMLTEEPNRPVTTRGQVFNYSSAEGGFDHTGVQDLVDWSTAFFDVRAGGQGTGLEITKEADLAVGQPVDPLTWTIRVNNPGTAAVADITVNDVIPGQVTVIDLSASEGSALVDGRTVTWTLGQLSPGQEATLTIRTRINADAQSPGALVNTALMYASGYQVGEAQTQVLIGVETLPRTGEKSARNLKFLVLFSVVAAVVLGHRALHH